ncbi:DUF11 domain-containing protein, partial [Polaribacter sp.]|uniref:DUF11 domain-containing protein n=1 Tax=Polaribacter sp. TaxID=1920175 RepID=UPI0035C83306
TVDKSVVKLNDIVTFTLTLSNKGPDAATGIQVKDLLPSGLEYVALGSEIPVNTTYNSITGIWDVSALDLLQNNSTVLKIRAKVTDLNVLIINKTEVFKTEQKDLDSFPNSGN